MKNIKWLIPVAAAGLVAGCDPYGDVKGGTPQVATFVGANSADGLTPVVGTATGTAWALTSGQCEVPGQLDLTTFHITFDRQIDGALVQTGLEDCTPANGWLTVTPAAAGGSAWYSCYSPSSPVPEEGGSIVVYRAPAGGSAGWGGEAEYLEPVTYHITGTVAGVAIDATVTPDATPCP